jgi:hypothetical protein
MWNTDLTHMPEDELCLLKSVEENIKIKPWDLNIGRGVWSDEVTETQKEIGFYRQRFDDE